VIAARIARRLARKAVKPLALYLVDLQLRSSQAREADMIIARGVTVPLEREERKRQVELIARRNIIRSW